MNLTGNYGTYSKPQTQKIYTTDETAELLNISCDEVRRIVNYYKIEHKIISTKKSRVIILTYDAVRLVKERYEEKQRRREEAARMAELKKQKHEEEIDGAEKHPLVKDKRFLSLSYFPDVVPDCFKECEA